MAKRIVSGIFILTALGALGVILAGALTSGEQLIVRFLTAVTVAALALYVISDLRLQSEQDDPPAERPRSAAGGSTPQAATAVMATVTGSHRIARAARKRRIDTAPTAPNFEAIQPITSSVRTASLADADGTTTLSPGATLLRGTFSDPTEEVTGSRLVPPSPQPDDRSIPPHPLAENRLGEPSASTPRPVSSPSPSAENDDQSASIPEVSDRSEHDRGSVIAPTSFTYSGRLESEEVNWPPRPPATDSRAAVDGNPAGMGAIDTPTAELPALLNIESLDIEGGSLDDILGRSDDCADRVDVAIFGEELPLSASGSGTVNEAEFLEIAEATGTSNGTEPGITTESADTVDDAELREIPPSGDAVNGTEVGEGPERAVSLPDRQIEAARYATPIRAEVPDKLTAAIRSGELQVINSLISQGMLTTDGPITDRDVRTMVYVAFTSNELRKIILAGGTPDGVRAGDLDLGTVELFDESRYAPPPKRLYSGRQQPPAVDSETVLDLTALESDTVQTVSSPPPDDDDMDTGELVPTLPAPKHLYRRADTEARIEH